MSDRPGWALTLPAAGETRAVVLVLHGGKAVSHDPSRARHLSAARLAPVAREVHRATRDLGAEVRMVRYRYRGWNHGEASPAADAAWALEVVKHERPGLPVVLVGHSMGGRAALRVGDDPSVVGLVLLAPWVEPGDPVPHLAGRLLRVLHGRRDRWTSPAASRAMTAAAEALGADVRYVDMGPVGHFMLRRRGEWRRLSTYLVADALLAAGVADGRGSAAGRTDRSPVPND